MRAVIQRAREARVEVKNETVGQIDNGLVILLGVEGEDDQQDVDWLAAKCAALRIFNDSDGLMNLSVNDVEGQALVVSQFTLHAKYKKGTRPSFIRAAKPDYAVPMYEAFCKALEKELGKPTQKGEFGADMDVHLINDGPVTIFVDTKNKE